MNLKLVKFIESRPNIWNPKHSKYTSAKFRDQTYAEFASKYGNEFTGQAVKDRWTNIRSTFANYLRKLNARKVKSDSEEYKVNWHLWEPCQFLLKVNRKINRESSKLNIKDENIDESFYSHAEQEFNSDENEFSEHDESNDSTTGCKNIAFNLVEVFKGVQNDAFGVNNTKNGNFGHTVSKKLSQMDFYNAAKASIKIMEILLLYDENNPHNPNNLKPECS